MHTVNSQYFTEKINNLRKSDIQNFQTNYFLNKLDDEIECFENENAIIILQPEKNFFKIFFAFCDINSFDKILSQLPQKEIYLEIISKIEIENNLKEIINKYFAYQTTYQKLYKKLKINNKLKTQKFIVDSSEIYNKIYTTFDVRFEHLMNKKSLINLINKNQVITVYKDNELKAFLIYKVQGSKAYLNHIVNYGDKENLIELWKLFYQELNNRQITYLDLWYNKQNKKAENMYNIEQFHPLNMYNFCYKKL